MTDAAPSEPIQARDISRDGQKIADMEYYDLLNCRGDASDLELKKGYRKQALSKHPDRGGDAEEFKMVGEAYRVLSDSNLRADYDKHGKKKPTDEVGVKEATEMFGQLFGGERFTDYIGEVSLLRDFGKASEIMMTEEEKEEMEKAMKESSQAANPQAAPGSVEAEKKETDSTATPTPAAAPAGATAPVDASSSGKAGVEKSDSHVALNSESPADKAKKEKAGRAKMTPEQRAKLEAFEKEKEEAEIKRVEDLTRKLKERIRPFVESKNPGDKDDPETQLFERKMREEAEDLKMESFGVELLNVIGNVYLTKSTTWIKTNRNNFLGLSGFFSRLKEKTGMVKETWSLLGSAINVQMSMEDMQKRQEKGDIDEEELKQMEMDMSGKMLLATWRGTRWEVTGVLRKVCEKVLNEKGVSDQVLLNRARALAFLGTIYKQVKADESDDERRELERLVAEAAQKKNKKSKKHSHGKETPPVVESAKA